MYNQNEQLPDFYSLDDIAKMFNIHRITAGRLLRTEDFPCFMIGCSYRVPRLLFNQWIVNHLYDTVVLSQKEGSPSDPDGK
jgi:hypothetical protein